MIEALEVRFFGGTLNGVANRLRFGVRTGRRKPMRSFLGNIVFALGLAAATLAA